MKRKTGRKRAPKTPALDNTERGPVDEQIDQLESEEPPLAPDKRPLASGGERVEPLTALDEEDDFEDGRSSSGYHSRRYTDPAGRGDVTSRARDVRMGVLSVEGGRDTALPPTPLVSPVSPGKGPLVTPRMRKRLKRSRRTGKRPAARRRR